MKGKFVPCSYDDASFIVVGGDVDTIKELAKTSQYGDCRFIIKKDGEIVCFNGERITHCHMMGFDTYCEKFYEIVHTFGYMYYKKGKYYHDTYKNFDRNLTWHDIVKVEFPKHKIIPWYDEEGNYIGPVEKEERYCYE